MILNLFNISNNSSKIKVTLVNTTNNNYNIDTDCSFIIFNYVWDASGVSNYSSISDVISLNILKTLNPSSSRTYKPCNSIIGTIGNHKACDVYFDNSSLVVNVSLNNSPVYVTEIFI